MVTKYLLVLPTVDTIYMVLIYFDYNFNSLITLRSMYIYEN